MSNLNDTPKVDSFIRRKRLYGLKAVAIGGSAAGNAQVLPGFPRTSTLIVYGVFRSGGGSLFGGRPISIRLSGRTHSRVFILLEYYL